MLLLDAGIIGCVGVRKAGVVGLCDPLAMEAERKGKPLQVSCYRAGDRSSRRGENESQPSWQEWPLGQQAVPAGVK